jgi:pyruvate/2-oxoglutarate dehydrogenase complex dihydrolipoamide acyltransferase (E2) component
MGAHSPVGRAADRYEAVSPVETWMADARQIGHIPGGLMQSKVDMTHAKEALERLRSRGLAATFAHLLVRAVALAIARKPSLYQTVCGYDRYSSAKVDIGLSMTGLETTLPLIVTDVDQTLLPALVGAVDRAKAAVEAREGRVQRIMWLLPFGFLRRWLLRRWYAGFSSRRRLAGTLEVSCDTNADMVVPLRFYTDVAITAGRVRDTVVVLDGEPAIRPMAWLTICVDHVAMDGMRGAALMRSVREILESEELVAEAAGAIEPARA